MSTLQTTQPPGEAAYLPNQKAGSEPSPRWVRVELNGEYVADSRRVRLVFEPDRTPFYAFPREDVRLDWLEPAPDEPGEADKIYWDVQVGERTIKKAAWSYPDPPASYAALKNHLVFVWHKMDHWYEEEEEVFVHPRDPYKRVDAIPSSRQVRVVIDGETVADTHRPTLLFETGLPTRYYIPPEDVRTGLLEPAQSTTSCPYKGVASYWSVRVGDETYRNLVWGYPDPIPECPNIEGLMCFYNEKVDIYVDGELQPRPQTPWS